MLKAKVIVLIFLVYVSYYKERTEILGSHQALNSKGTLGKVWATKGFFLDIPEEADMFRIWFRNNDGTKQASYDNISLIAQHTDNLINPDANFDMNTTDSQGFPVGYTTTGTVTAETETVYDGTGLKLSNTESDAVSTVTGSFITLPLNVEEHYELLVSYKLFDVPDDTSGGAKLSIQSTHSSLTDYSGQEKYNATDYFVKNSLSGDGWRQMMVMFVNGGMWIDFTVELSGIGTLYIDEITLRKASYIVNGDFLGRSSDYAAAGWTDFDISWRTSSSDVTEGALLVEELSADGKTYNNYVVTNYSMAIAKLRQNIYYVSGENVGDTYKISADFKITGPNKNSFGMYFGTSDGLVNKDFWTTLSPDNWSNKEVYAQCATVKVFGVTIKPRAAADSNYFDNIKMEKVAESISFMKEGEVISEAVAGEIDISYRRPGTTFDETEPSVTMVAAVYAHEGEKTQLHSIQMLTDKAVFDNTVSGYKYTGTEPASGYRPVMLDHTVNVPEAADGVTYSVKAMFWDGASTMHPAAAKATLPAVTQ